VLAYTIYHVSKLIHIKSDIIQKQLSKLNTLSHESFSGIRLLKAFNQEKSFIEDFSKASEDYKTKSLDLVRVEAMFFPVVTLLIGLSTIITILVGGFQVIEGKITYGNIVEFVYYINLLTWPVTALGWIASIIQRADVSQARINEFLMQKNISAISGKKLISNFEGNIEFNNVCFTYPETGINAINNLSLKIHKGQKVAIVGKTGAGKSTIAQLLLKMYNPSKGQIRIDTNELCSLNAKSYRDFIGYVPQDYFLFSDTIKNNITFGCPEANYKKIEEYAALACIDSDISNMEVKYETYVGERGITLSGGQKQRLSLARALIKEPSLLILDDCLSSVDTETEYKILNNLKNIYKKRTVLFITHRLLSLKSMDNIIVLNNGDILQEGTFDELILNDGLFKQLYDQQRLESKNEKDQKTD
jgi:ATP-binding cassette subfamily B protein